MLSGAFGRVFCVFERIDGMSPPTYIAAKNALGIVEMHLHLVQRSTNFGVEILSEVYGNRHQHEA
jgi:hypothetical protein